MSEPIADGVPVLPPVPVLEERLEVDHVAPRAVDLGTGEAREPSARHSHAAAATPSRASRRAAPDDSEGRSLLDHPAVLVALSLLALVALVIGIDQASQGTWVALVPAALLAVGYALVVRRRRRRARG